MLRFAVNRSRAHGPNGPSPHQSKLNQNTKRDKFPQPSQIPRPDTDKDKFSYVICDARSGGLYVRHVSKEFEQLFGCDGSECTGLKANQFIGSALSSSTLKKAFTAEGLTEEEANDVTHRMAKAAGQIPSKTERCPVSLLLSVRPSGDLFACEMSWCHQRHPVLGWSYHVGFQREISEGLSAGELLEAARDDLSYERICSSWAQTSMTSPQQNLSEKMDSMSERFHAVAEQVWKNELAKGLKPKGSSKRAEADTSSIWSRSTASTLASKKGDESKQEIHEKTNNSKRTRPHHFAALVMPEYQAGAAERSQEPHESDGFESLSEPEPGEWQECATPPASEPHVDLNQTIESKETDPVQHVQNVAKGSLDSLKAPFVIAAPTVEGCPVALRSAGFEHLPVSEHVKSGSDLRKVLQPSSIRASMEWKAFSENVLKGNFWETEGLALLNDCELRLPAGELAFVHCFSRLGHSHQCLVYAKQVELDDCQFLLVLCSCSSNPGDGVCGKTEFNSLSEQMDVVVSALASHFFYLAPMRRQNFLA